MGYIIGITCGMNKAFEKLGKASHGPGWKVTGRYHQELAPKALRKKLSVWKILPITSRRFR
jgi:hypothetical protein